MFCKRIFSVSTAQADLQRAGYQQLALCFLCREIDMQTLKPSIKMANQAIARSGSSTKRLTGNSLYAIHRRLERESPRLCAHCESLGLVGYGKELDHIVPLWQGGAESDSNRQWLCEVHHQEKTSAEASQRAVIDGGRVGKKSKR